MIWLPYLSSQTYKIQKAKYYLEHIVNIPCSSNLTKQNVIYISECLKNPKKNR
jgi:dTDP-4-amino-4,6-dideoxygalactose transaminase